MTLYIPVGVPASGKSHLSGKLIEAGVITANMIVSPDNIRAWVTGDRADQSANGVVFEVTEMVAAERLRRGLSVYLDATNLTDPKGMLDRLAHYAELSPSKSLTDPPVVTIIMDTPMDECWARNQAREQHRVPDKIMDRMMDRFVAGEHPRHGTVLTATEIVDRLAEFGVIFLNPTVVGRVGHTDLDRKT